MYAIILSEQLLETTTGGCFTYDLILNVLVTCLCHTSPQQLPVQPEFGAALQVLGSGSSARTPQPRARAGYSSCPSSDIERFELATGDFLCEQQQLRPPSMKKGVSRRNVSWPLLFLVLWFGVQALTPIAQSDMLQFG